MIWKGSEESIRGIITIFSSNFRVGTEESQDSWFSGLDSNPGRPEDDSRPISNI
jgi:hypothetical protein